MIWASAVHPWPCYHGNPDLACLSSLCSLACSCSFTILKQKNKLWHPWQLLGEEVGRRQFCVTPGLREGEDWAGAVPVHLCGLPRSSSSRAWLVRASQGHIKICIVRAPAPPEWINELYMHQIVQAVSSRVVPHIEHLSSIHILQQTLIPEQNTVKVKGEWQSEILAVKKGQHNDSYTDGSKWPAALATSNHFLSSHACLIPDI